MLVVEVHLLHQSEPVVIDNARNAYVKAGLYCVLKADGTVDKFPIEHVFRIREH